MKQVQPKQFVFDTEIVTAITSIFKERFEGKKKAVKTNDLLAMLRTCKHVDLAGRDLRKYVGYIRKHDLLQPGYILSNVGCGYWYSLDASEQDSYIDQEMTRMSHQFENLESLHKRRRYNNSKPKTEQIPLFQT